MRLQGYVPGGVDQVFGEDLPDVVARDVLVADDLLESPHGFVDGHARVERGDVQSLLLRIIELGLADVLGLQTEGGVVDGIEITRLKIHCADCDG